MENELEMTPGVAEGQSDTPPVATPAEPVAAEAPAEAPAVEAAPAPLSETPRSETPRSETPRSEAPRSEGQPERRPYQSRGGPGRGRPGGMGRGRGRRQPLPKDLSLVNFKNVDLLQRFLNESAQIKPRRKTGASAKQQRILTRAIKRARYLALLPYTASQTRG